MPKPTSPSRLSDAINFVRLYGVGLGGMTFCMLGMLVILGAALSPRFFEVTDSFARMLALDNLWNANRGVDAVSNFKQILLVIGAALLCKAAFERGKEGRLFQVLEAELVFFGVLFFLPLSESVIFWMRITVMICGALILYKLGFLKGWVNKVGALGLEGLGVGYALGSNEGMFFGGLFLTIYCAVGLYKESNFLNVLWLALNGPFAGVSLALCLIPYVEDPINVTFGCIFILTAVPFTLIAHQHMDDEIREAKAQGALILHRPGYPGSPGYKEAVCPTCRRPWDESCAAASAG